MIRVAIVDDHAIVRIGLRALLGAEPDMVLVGEAATFDDAISLASRDIDIYLVDLSLGDSDGVRLIRRLRQEAPRARALVLSMHATPEYVLPAIRAGARGYVVKGSGLAALVDAIRVVFGGGRYVDPAIDFEVASAMSEGGDAEWQSAEEKLTARERQVLRLVALGHTNRSIAAMLELSPKTVDAHRTNLMRKLDLHDAQALTRLAVKLGLVDG